MKIKLGISNKHVHLNEEVKNILFGEGFNLEVKRELLQKGEFASTSKVTLEANGKTIENVRVVGPLRNYTQVELLKSDALILGINPPYRKSGDLENSETIKIIGEVGEVILENSTIIADRHIHIPTELAKEEGYEDNKIVKIKKDNIVINDVKLKVGDDYILELHLDKDDAEKYNLENDDLFEIIKEDKC